MGLRTLVWFGYLTAGYASVVSCSKDDVSSPSYRGQHLTAQSTQDAKPGSTQSVAPKSDTAAANDSQDAKITKPTETSKATDTATAKSDPTPTGSSTPVKGMAFTADLSLNVLQAFRVDGDKKSIEVLASQDTGPASAPASFLATRDHKTLLVGMVGTKKIAVYELDVAKALATKKSEVETGNTSATFLAFTPDEKYFYSANYGEGTVSMYSWNAAKAMFLGTVPAGIHPHSVAVNPSGKWIYVPNAGSDTISVYAVGSDGRLTFSSNVTLPASFAPRIMRMHPKEPNRAYVIGEGGGLAFLNVSDDGAATVVQQIPMGKVGGDIAFNGSGKVLYGTSRGDNMLAIVDLAGDGRMTLRKSIAAGNFPNSLDTDQRSHLLFCSNWFGGDMTVWSMNDSDGELTTVTTVKGEGAKAAVSVIFVPEL